MPSTSSEHLSGGRDRQLRSQISVPALTDNAYGVPRGAGANNGDLDDPNVTSFPALSAQFRSIMYPENFKPNIAKYDGRSDPNIWLRTFYVAAKAAGGTFDHMAAYFPLVMGEAPLLWLDNLPAGSINSWANLSRAFTQNFQTTYSRPGNAHHLSRIIMKPKERLRDYTDRFFKNRNTCIGVRDDQIVESYKKGIKEPKIFEKIHESGAATIAELMVVVNKLIDTEEALLNQFNIDAGQGAGISGAAAVADFGPKLRKRSSEVLTADGRRSSTFLQAEFDATLDSICEFHEGAKYTLHECSQLKKAMGAPEEPK